MVHALRPWLELATAGPTVNISSLAERRGDVVWSDVDSRGVRGLVSMCVFFSSRRRHTRLSCDWSSDVCSSDLMIRHTRLSCDWSSDVCSSDLMIRHTRLSCDWSSDVCSSD